MEAGNWITQVEKLAGNYIHWFGSREQYKHEKVLVEEVMALLVGKEEPNDVLLQQLGAPMLIHFSIFIEQVLKLRSVSNAEELSRFLSDTPFLERVLWGSLVQKDEQFFWGAIGKYVGALLANGTVATLPGYMKLLKGRGFEAPALAVLGLGQPHAVFVQPQLMHTPSKTLALGQKLYDNALTPFGQFVADLLKPAKGLLGFGSNTKHYDVMHRALGPFYYSIQWKALTWFRLALLHCPEAVAKKWPEHVFCTVMMGRQEPVVEALLFWLQEKPKEAEKPVNEVMEQYMGKTGLHLSLLFALNQAIPGKYHNRLVSICESNLARYRRDTADVAYRFELPTVFGPVVNTYFNYLIGLDSTKGWQRVKQYLDESNYVAKSLLDFFEAKGVNHTLPYLIGMLQVKASVQSRLEGDRFYDRLFALLTQADISDDVDAVLDFMVHRASTATLKGAAQLLAQYQPVAGAKAEALLKGKTVNERIAGVSVLALWQGEQVEALLEAAVNDEKSDEVRDAMLDALKESRFAKPYGFEQVQAMVAAAAKRKKLAKWAEKWLEEEGLPPVWYKNGEQLSQQHVRFLLYRMKRAKGMNADIEARQQIYHIDTDKSGPFALALLTAFSNSNANVKLKYYLTTAGLIGNDAMTQHLSKLFKESMAAKRMKMAEYVVGAMAMVGTDKALRGVEFIYRKFGSKKPALREAARTALTAAAEELGITMDQLSDKIIPDFGFEDNYRTFEAGGQTYRAFIAADFKVNYLNDDNKVRKSAPAGTDKALKAEFKEVEKELRDITKSQGVRLEKYMVEARDWPTDEWHSRFFGNPVLFVYALKVLWGLFTDNGELVTAFYCADDAGCYTVDDDEVNFDEGLTVRILHPYYLNPEQITQWKDKLYDMGLQTIFPIVERKVYTVDAAEEALDHTNFFYQQKVPRGADFVNAFLVKRNWLKTAGDGGRSEFSKLYHDGDIYADAYIAGPTAFYQEGQAEAEIFEVTFYRKHHNDKITLKEVPPIFFSETMYDLDLMLQA